MKSVLPLLCAFVWSATAAEPRLGKNQTPTDWRAEKRLIDLHLHINSTPEHIKRAVKIMDEVGIGVGVNLSGGTVTSKDGAASIFEKNRKLAEEIAPGRLVLYMNLDYSGWDEVDFAERAVKQIEDGHRLGAAGLKEYKRLGLNLRDKSGNLIRIDDPKLDGVWKRCGELGMPISIHVADPKAFWEPYDDKNERWTELKDHKNWWFGDPAVHPPRMELLEALNRVIERHPKTTFVCVHFANNAEDLDWVERALDKYPNMNADLAARIPEIGRHAPEKVQRLFVKHQDRIFFATDFQVYDRITLGSGGSGPAPTDDDARDFFEKHWRWLETNDRDFEHMTPIQGDWKISAIGLPNEVLRKIYFDNAQRLLARSLPFEVCRVARVNQLKEWKNLKSDGWDNAPAHRLEYNSNDASAAPESSTLIRALYDEMNLYIRYDAPYSELTAFEPARMDSERVGLWDRDVVEAFIGTDSANEKVYYEFEVAPTNEKLDLVITPEIPDVVKRLEWNSGWESAVELDKEAKVWRTVMRIPLKALHADGAKAGTRWRVNFYRIDRANRAFLAFNPTLTRSFHAPERFGWLEFLP
ncbi:MAG TPA: amidohydrolase family protein [Verrucomicrobiae bacterium]